MNMEESIIKSNVIKKLTVTNSILTTIAIVPILGEGFVNLGGFAVMSLIAIIILLKQQKLSVNKVPNFLVLIGSIMAIISIVLASNLEASNEIINMTEAEALTSVIPFFVVAFTTWVLFLVAMIMYWINLRKLNKMTEE